MNLLLLSALACGIGYLHGVDVGLLVFLVGLPVIGLAELLFNH